MGKYAHARFFVLALFFGLSAGTFDSISYTINGPGNYVIVTDSSVCVWNVSVNVQNGTVKKKMYHYKVKPNGKLLNDTTYIVKIKPAYVIPEVDSGFPTSGY